MRSLRYTALITALVVFVALGMSIAMAPVHASPPIDNHIALSAWLNGLGTMSVYTGTVGNDTLIGTDDADTIYSLAGDDIIEGRGGNDFLHGGPDGDILYGNLGDDLLDGSAGDDRLLGGDGDDKLVGGLGADQLDGGNGTDWANYYYAIQPVEVNLITGVHTGDAAIGDSFLSIETFALTNHPDKFTGDGNSITIFGWGGDDILTMGSGDDLVLGGDGNDILQGGPGNDTLDGQRGNDHYYGEAGDDRLVSSAEADVLDGGDGRDVVTYYYAPEPISIDLLSGSHAGYGAVGDTYRSIEALELSQHDDVLTADGKPYTIFGWGGNDTITMSSGDDAVFAGDGDDTVRGESGVDVLDGQRGNDFILGGNGDDALHGGSGNDILDGQRGNDAYFGEAGDDRLVASGEPDVMNGGAGTDVAVYYWAPEAITIDLVSGTNTGYGAIGDSYSDIEAFELSQHDDSIITNDAPWIVKGWDGNDHITTGSGNDTIYGGNGADTIHPGPGVDLLYGDGAHDTFVIKRGDGKNTIGDFTDQDEVDLSDFGMTFAELDANGDGVLNGADAKVTVSDGNLLIVFNDSDSLEFVNLVSLDADNFIF